MCIYGKVECLTFHKGLTHFGSIPYDVTLHACLTRNKYDVTLLDMKSYCK